MYNHFCSSHIIFYIFPLHQHTKAIPLHGRPTEPPIPVRDSTCQCARVSEGPHAGVGELREQGHQGVHQVAVEHDAVLTLGHQHRHKVTELRVEPAAVRTRLDQRVLSAVLQQREVEVI